MRLVSFASEAGPKSGCLIEGDKFVVDLAVAHGTTSGTDVPVFITQVEKIAAGGAAAFDAASDAVRKGAASGAGVLAVCDVKLMAPIPHPPQMRDFLCFEKHLLQGFERARRLRASEAPDPVAALETMEREGFLRIPEIWYQRPVFYHPSRFSVVGTDEDVRWPAYSQTMDYELEFGCYIGAAAKDIPLERAREHIFGYTIFNDFSARDEQVKDMQSQLGPGKGKDFDGANAMGPCLVTADEIPNPYELEMVVRVNGEERGRGNTRDMHWKFEDLIAHVSRSETLHSGEFFGSGTVGNGCGLEIDKLLQSGDVVELEIERIGVLRNKVFASAA